MMSAISAAQGENKKKMSPFQTPIQELMFYDRYARWNEQAGRRETWEEACQRVQLFFAAELDRRNISIATEVWKDLYEGMLNMEAMPSMRILQMAGPALERCNVGAYNCAYLPIDSFQSFAELLYILMQGTGVGFSVEERYVDELPKIKKQKGNDPWVHVITDDTEGWCNALLNGLQMWSQGHDVTFDYSLIRPQGAVLKTKGGRASGPEPLRQLLDFVRSRLLSRQGSYLTPLDAHDIACYCGQIVQVGGVRRAAEISLSDLSDRDMRDAKAGQFWLNNVQRSMANNSAVFEGRPDVSVFLEEWLSLMKSGTGERGLFNREGAISQRPSRRKKADFGTNPCGEIILRPRQFCNLSIAIARVNDTTETLQRKVRLAAIWGTFQSMLTDFTFISPKWRENCEEERLLGVDITGQLDCPLLSPTYAKRSQLLQHLQRIAVHTNMEFARKLDIPESAAVTCVKPSGNSAQLFNCSSGLHPRFANYYLRRIRIGAYTPMAKFLRDAGVPVYPEVGQSEANASVLVFEFPVQAPPKAITRHDLTALDQLNNWLVWKQKFTEHNPSVTIYVDDHEWIAVAAWVYENWDQIGGLSFLPKSNHSYALAPYEELSKEEYELRTNRFPALDFTLLSNYEKEDTTEVNREFACTGDRCEL